jgi:hypothetical protein
VKEAVKVVVVIPVGPLGSNYAFQDIVDTISSVVHYASADRRIIALDNFSPLHLADRLKATFPELLIIRMPRNYGYFGGLYKAVSLGLLYAYSAFDFQVLVKMDTDALMINRGLEDDAIHFLENNANVGQLGTHLVDGEGVAWPRQQLMKHTSVAGWLKDREQCNRLRQLVVKAQSHGYALGEHVLGGVSIFSPAFVDRLVQQGLLLDDALSRSKLGEDHLWGLLCKAVGMDLGQFGSAESPMGVAWRGLPCSPEELVSRGKKVIHSTRFWKGMTEEQIRQFFRLQRLNTLIR